MATEKHADSRGRTNRSMRRLGDIYKYDSPRLFCSSCWYSLRRALADWPDRRGEAPALGAAEHPLYWGVWSTSTVSTCRTDDLQTVPPGHLQCSDTVRASSPAYSRECQGQVKYVRSQCFSDVTQETNRRRIRQDSSPRCAFLRLPVTITGPAVRGSRLLLG